MGKGYSLHIGLNYVDPNHYGGWDGKLNACEYDADDMEAIANNMGFETKKFLRADATREAVKKEIVSFSEKLKSEDILWISYSGHGGQVPDQNSDEEDAKDETWCLYNGQLIDDELFNLWSLFAEGVRILVISDSCHSGSLLKSMGAELTTSQQGFGAKNLPTEVASSTYFLNKQFYDQLLEENKALKPIKASVKLISGCQDNQYSYDGTFNGQFTGQLKQVWNGGKFNGNYSRFHKKIVNNLPIYQTPNLMNLGEPNEDFDNQKPFHI
ncbi:MAG: caspase family protein [Bacteroidota bacterium]